jgi:hypothetical protein
MGSSHAEPMLRNNVGEWKADPHAFNYRPIRKGVLAYWEERVADQRGLRKHVDRSGMRGIHDSGMRGRRPIRSAPRCSTGSSPTSARCWPGMSIRTRRFQKMFVPYKEVLDI